MARLEAELLKDGKMNLGQILAMRFFELHHNKWIIRVPGKVFENFLIQEPGLVDRMREFLGQPRLFWEVIVDESLVKDHSPRTLTSEERLLALQEKYPQLEAFLRKFNLSVRPDTGG